MEWLKQQKYVFIVDLKNVHISCIFLNHSAIGQME